MSASPATSPPLVVYSAAERRYCESLLRAYRSRHPHDDVVFEDGISAALDRRFRDEVDAGRPSADVVWSTAMDLQASLVSDGYAATIAPRHAGDLPEGSAYRECAYATTLEPLVTLVDAARIVSVHAGALSEIAELIEREPERFRGRVIGYDITRNGLGFLALMHERRLRPGFDRYLEALRRVAPRVHPSNPPILAELAAGQAWLAPHVLGSYATRALREHPSLAIAASALPAIAVSRVALVSRAARNPDAALRFVDFLLSDEGQAELADAGLFPLRRAAPGGGMAALPLAPVRLDATFDTLLDAGPRNDLLERWSRAVDVPVNVRTLSNRSTQEPA